MSAHHPHDKSLKVLNDKGGLPTTTLGGLGIKPPVSRDKHCLGGHMDEVRSVCFSPDGRLALAGCDDKTAILWDVASGRIVRRLEGHSGWVESVCFSPDGQLALTAGGEDKTSIIWDVASGRIVRQLTGHTNSVLSVCFSPDGRHAITGGGDGAIFFWNIATGERLVTMYT